MHRFRRFGSVFRNPIASLPLRAFDGLDVVQSPATYPGYSDLFVARARARGTPTVLDYHFSPMGTSPLARVAVRAYQLTLGRLVKRADFVLVKSRTYAARAPELRGVARRRIRSVPNGVDAARFAPVPGKDDHVLCVGRLVPYKGVAVLLRAMKDVQARTHAPLVVAGDGPLRRALESDAARLGVDARFLGHVPDAALPRLYARARATVLPSVNGQEAFGMALLESMACATPVVASRLPGVTEIARLGGVVARPGDANDLARAILDVLEDRARLPDARVTASRVRRRFGWDAIARRLERVYGEAITRTGARRG